MKRLFGLSRSAHCASALLFCAAVLFLPSSAVGATYTSTVKITQPNTVLSGDIITVPTGRGLEAGIKNAGELNNVKISTSGFFGWGVMLESADLTVKNSDISTTGSVGTGVYLDKSTINITDSSISTAHGNGIYSKNGSAVTVEGGTINAAGTTGDQPYGAYAEVGSSLDISGTNIVVSGDQSHGVGVNQNSSLKLTNVSIDVTGVNARGIWVQDSSSADIKDTVVTMRGNEGTGAQILNSSAVQMDNVRITTYGDVSSYGDLGHGVRVTSGWPGAPLAAATPVIKNSVIKTFGRGTAGVMADNGSKAQLIDTDVETSGVNAQGLYAVINSSLEMTGGSLTTAGNGASAGYAFNKSEITLDSTKINVGGIAYAFRMYDGTVNLKNIRSLTNQEGLLAQTGSTGTFNLNASEVSGKIYHRGDSRTIGAFDISLTDSTWSGYAQSNRDVYDANININLDNLSLWNVNGDTYTNGTLANSGVVNFGSSKEEGFKEVSVYNYYAGDGVLVMKTDLNNKEKSDLLLVGRAAGGRSSINVYNTAPSGAERSEALVKVMSNTTEAEFDLGNADLTIDGVSYVSAGAWKYRLANGPLLVPMVASASSDKDAPPVGPGLTPIGPREWYLLRDGTTPTGDAITKAAVQHDLWYTETNTMTKRLGIYRDNLWNGGLWFEAAANKENFKTDETNMLNENQNFKTGTIGYDFKKESANGIWWYGLMAGYGKNTSDLIGGVGELDIKSYHASLYAVYRDNGGMYINTILKYNKYKNDMRINYKDSFTQSLQGYDGGEWDQNGLGISLQAGKKYEIADSDGWYWEPQLQFSWNRVFASDYTTKSGITVNIDDIDYIRLRGGVVIGKQITFADGRLLDLYGDLSVIHDFDGDAVLRMSGAEHKSSLGGTWATIGLGANYRYAQGKFMHLRFQYSDGTSYREPFTVYAGLSFETN